MVHTCVSSLGERRAKKTQLAPSSDFSQFHVFVLTQGPDLEILRTVAVSFFHLDLTWILSVKVGFCTPVGYFEGAVSPLADFRDRQSGILISLFYSLEAEFSHYKDFSWTLSSPHPELTTEGGNLLTQK